MNSMAFEIDNRRTTGDLHLDPPETVVAETRMPTFFALALERVTEPLWRSRAALRHCPICIQQIARRHLHNSTLRAPHRDLRPSGDILSQIVDHCALLRLRLV